MALQVKVGTLTQPTSTGNQAVTGIGFQPKFILFFITNQAAIGNSVNLQKGYGMAISSSARASISVFGTNGSTLTSYAERYYHTSFCISLINVSSVVSQADFVSMDSDGFTINWTTVDSTQRIVGYIAVGGTDLSNVNILGKSLPAGTGNSAFTGMGFKPDMLFQLTALDASTGLNTQISSNIGFGVTPSNAHATSLNAQGVINTVSDSSETSDIFEAVNGTTFAVQASLVSMDSDGFTWNFASTISARLFSVLGGKGGNWKTNSFNQPSSTGNQAITGVGFKPTGLILMSANHPASATPTSGGRQSLGFTDGNNQICIWGGNKDAVGTTVNNTDIDNTQLIKMMTEAASPTVNAKATIVSFDNDGFTINWGSADATAREIVYLAFGNNTITAIPSQQQMALMGVGS